MNLKDYKPPKPLLNLKEEFWYSQFYCNQECPECEIMNDMLVTMTKRSVRLTCRNESCKKAFFYRRVNLGVIEGFKFEDY